MSTLIQRRAADGREIKRTGCVNPCIKQLNVLTLEALNYFYMKHGDQRVFSI